ncbi:hypothetical protein LQW54_006659 [Pestalotiopsis sp. IQ-011]
MQPTFATVTTAVLALSSAATADPSTTHPHTVAPSTSDSVPSASWLPLMPSTLGSAASLLPIQTGSVPIVYIPPTNATGADAEAKTLVERPILPRGGVSEADVKKKLEETPGAAWAISCFDGCNKGVPCLIACTTDYETKGKGNKPDAATVDKAYEALPRILSLLDCIKSSGSGPGGLIQCILRPAVASLDQIPDADKKIDEASKTLDCAGACTGGNKGGCLLNCLNKH